MKATQLLETERVRHSWRHHCFKEKSMQALLTGLGPEAMHRSLSPIQFVGREYHDDIVGWLVGLFSIGKRSRGSKMWPTHHGRVVYKAGRIVIQLVLRHILRVS
jgi:hypothetical protein